MFPSCSVGNLVALDEAITEDENMTGPRDSSSANRGATRRAVTGLILGAPLLGACAGMSSPFSSSTSVPAGPAQQPAAIGTGKVKVGLVLPLSATGNAGVAAQSMRNAAEMALAEFQNPNVQLLVKDDGGSPQGESRPGASQQTISGAEQGPEGRPALRS